MKNMEQRKAMRIGPVQMSGNGFSRKKGRGTDTSASFGIPVAVSFGERERTGEVEEEGWAGQEQPRLQGRSEQVLAPIMHCVGVDRHGRSHRDGWTTHSELVVDWVVAGNIGTSLS